jgi:GT2 family glycosyltransferase
VIIVVSHNTRDLLLGSLSELMPSAARVRAEVVVVDNASSDGSAEMVAKRFPAVRLIANDSNVGFARANNQAIEATSSRCVLLLNSDAYPQGTALEALLHVMECDGRVAIAGPRMHDAHSMPLASAHSFESLPKLAGAALGIHRILRPSIAAWATRLAGRAGAQHRINFDASAPADADWVSGACMMVRRSVLANVGLLDERYFMYMEDEDLCRRVREAGYRVVYVPSSRVVHHVGGSTASSAIGARLYRDSRLIYHRRYNSRLYPAFWLLSNLYAARQRGLARLFELRTAVGMQSAGVRG